MESISLGTCKCGLYKQVVLGGGLTVHVCSLKPIAWSYIKYFRCFAAKEVLLHSVHVSLI